MKFFGLIQKHDGHMLVEKKIWVTELNFLENAF
jgi:hypothetical protein